MERNPPLAARRCSGEADQEVAKASADDDTGRTFAVGSDSDFFIFERCRYINFDDLKVCVGVCVFACVLRGNGMGA